MSSFDQTQFPLLKKRIREEDNMDVEIKQSLAINQIDRYSTFILKVRSNTLSTTIYETWHI